MRLKHENKRFHNGLFYDINERFIKKYDQYYKGKVYDFGCGNKPYQSYFEEKADSYIGIDIKGENYSNCADLFFDLNKPIDLEENIADAILSLSVIEHLESPQVMINEADRILKSTGVLILQVPFQWKIHDAPYDYYRYTRYGIEKMLNKSGFTSYTIEEQMGFFSMMSLKTSYFLNKFVKGPKIVKVFISLLFVPFSFFIQCTGLILDYLFPFTKDETLGYFIVAKK